MSVQDPLAQRVATRHRSADSLDQYSRAAKNVGELLKQMIEDAHAGVDANYVQPIGEQLPRILGDYKHYVMALAKGIDTIPKGKEQQRAKKIVKELEQVFSKGFDYKWEGSRWLSPSTTEKALKKLEPLVDELDKLLTGQRVLFKSATDPLQAFQDALLVRRVVARHLERISKEVDHAVAEAEGAKAQKRFDENKKTYSEMESLKKKVEDADPSAKKKFDKAYAKLFEAGEDAVKAAKKLLQKYPDVAEGSKGNEKKQREASLKLLESGIRKWESNKIDHHKANQEFTSAQKKMDQAANTYGYAQELESLVKDFHKVLKDPDTVLDDSWRR